MLDICQKGKADPQESLSTLFEPLRDGTLSIEDFEKNKAKNHWVRIYAIRIDQNLFVITGGAIKLTRTMNDRDHLLKELDKLELVKGFLERRGDDESLDFYVFSLY
jgi:hypothetical protein